MWVGGGVDAYCYGRTDEERKYECCERLCLDSGTWYGRVVTHPRRSGD